MKTSIFLAAIAAVIVSSPPPATADVTEGLVAFYPFTGNANDSSGNARHLTVTDASLVSDRYGRAKAAYVFNGSSSILAAANAEPALGLSEKCSISCWAKIASFNPNGSTLVRHDGDVGFNILNYQSPNRLAIEAFKGGQQYRGFTGTPPAGEWCMLTATWDGTTFAMYINGVAQSVDQDNFGRVLPVQPITVGGSIPWPDQTLNGAIDEVRIYNRALTAEEVGALYSLNDGPQTVFTGAWYETKASRGSQPGAGELQIMLFSDKTCTAVREFNDLPFDLGEGTWAAGKKDKVTVQFTSDFAGEAFSGTVKNGLLNGSFIGGGYSGKFFTCPLPDVP
jgi:hypothetical protein